MGVAILLLVALWAAGMFKGKPKTGSLVLENVPADAEVLVDGQTVSLTRDGAEVTMTAVAEGSHRLKAVQGGKEIWSSDVTVKRGDPVRLKVEPQGSAPDRLVASALEKKRAESLAAAQQASKTDLSDAEKQAREEQARA